MQTAPITDLIGHLDALLNPNGLQVPANAAFSTLCHPFNASSFLHPI
jgi:hypothetical protein